MHRHETPSRLTLWVLVMTMVWLTSCASRQATVIPYATDDQPTSGVVYYLPKTQLRIHSVLSEEQFEPGPLIAYASRYSGENYPTQPVMRYQMERVVMHAHDVPDEAQGFLIESVALPSVEQLASLTSDGLFYPLHGEAYQPAITDYLADYPKVVASQETSQALFQEYAPATSHVKQAEVTVNRFSELRERRVELLSGQVETMLCDGPALKMVLDGLDKELAAPQALFVGRTTRRYYEEVVGVPITEPATQQVVARFAPQYGLVDKEGLSGAPIYIDVKALKRPAPLSESELCKLIKSKAPRYIEPRRACVSLQLPECSQAIALELSAAQWGRPALLRHKLGVDKLGQLPCTVCFDLTSGSIELIELPRQ